MSLDDWVIWDRALRRRAILNPSSWEQVLQPVRLNSGNPYPYGFGFDLPEGPGPRVVRHNGFWQGFGASYAHYVDEGLSIVVLCNLEEAQPQRIIDRLAARLVPELATPPPVPTTDPNPARTARVRSLLDATAGGSLSADDFEFVRAGFLQHWVTAYPKRLEGLGPVLRIDPVEGWLRGDDTYAAYRAVIGNKTFLVRIQMTPSGRLSEYSIAPDPSP
jgi:hypothetical protein